MRSGGSGGAGAVLLGVLGTLLALGLTVAAWTMLNGGMAQRLGEPLTVVPMGLAPAAVGPATAAEAAEAPPGLVSVQDWEWHGPSATLTVTGVVLGVVEQGGECELAVSRDGLRLVGTSAGAAAGYGTACTVALSDAALVGEEWDIALEYRNAAGESRSAAIRVRLD